MAAGDEPRSRASAASDPGRFVHWFPGLAVAHDVDPKDHATCGSGRVVDPDFRFKMPILVGRSKGQCSAAQYAQASIVDAAVEGFEVELMIPLDATSEACLLKNLPNTP